MPADKTAAIPTIGRIVHYCLTEDDCAVIRQQRRPKTLNDVVSGFGNGTNPGDIIGMFLTGFFQDGNTHGKYFVNGQCILDGNDSLWVTTVKEGVDPGQWHWPPRA